MALPPGFIVAAVASGPMLVGVITSITVALTCPAGVSVSTSTAAEAETVVRGREGGGALAVLGHYTVLADPPVAGADHVRAGDLARAEGAALALHEGAAVELPHAQVAIGATEQ